MRMLSIAVLCGVFGGTLRAQEPAPQPAPVPPRAKPNPPRVVVPLPPAMVWDLDLQVAHELRARLDQETARAHLESLRSLDPLQLDEMRVEAGMLGARVAAELQGGELPRLAEELRMAVQERVGDVRAMAGLDRLEWFRPTQGTPEDSLYRAARESLNRGEYARAASLFQSFEQKFPRSRFAATTLYYQAFALYRSGSTDNLRGALDALRTQQEKYPERAADPDVGALRTRVYAALAARGDASAAAALRAATSTGSSCDEEDMSVRAEALNALAQLDPENASAAIKRVLARRDECSVSLRRRAVYLLGRTGNEPSVTDLMEVARTDPDPSVRSDAISQLGRSSFASVNSRMLLQLFNAAEDERTKQAVLSALRARGGAESRAALRSIAGQADLPERVRAQAILQLAGENRGSFAYERVPAAGSGHAATVSVSSPRPSMAATESAIEEEDAAFLRTLYPRTDSRTIRSAIISVIGRAGGGANDQWLMAIVRNSSEDGALRREALSRMKGLSVEELSRLYDALSEREFRNAIVSQLASREETQAVDKLIEIAKTSTDPQVRRQAIQALTRRKDPKATAFIRDLVEKP
jgi:HEAT repeat protein